MMVMVETDEGEVSLDDTSFAPPTLGEFLEAAIKRRQLTSEQVARTAGVSVDKLNGILGGEVRLDKPTARKLDRVFPKTSRILLRIQLFRDYYDEFGVLRPDSPIARRAVERRHRLSQLARA